MKVKTQLYFLAIVCFFSCTKDPVTIDSVDYFIFGRAGCECGGNCGTFYKYFNDMLVEGDGQSCQVNHHTFNGSALTADDKEQAEMLLNAFPDHLFYIQATSIGCPDCFDQGFYYIEIQTDGNNKSWKLDRSVEAVPEYLWPFLQKIEETMNALQ